MFYVEQIVNDVIFPKTESLLYNQNKGGQRMGREKSANQSNTLLLKLNFNWVNIAFISHFWEMKIFYNHPNNSCFSSQMSEGMDKELKVILSYSQCKSMSISIPQEKYKLILVIHKIPWRQTLPGTSKPYHSWSSTSDQDDQKVD